MNPSLYVLPPELMVTFDVWVTGSVKPPSGWVPLIDQEILSRLGLANPQSFTDNRFPLKAAVRVNLVNALDHRIQDQVLDPAGFAAVAHRMGIGDVVLRNDLQYERFDVISSRDINRS